MGPGGGIIIIGGGPGGGIIIMGGGIIPGIKTG